VIGGSFYGATNTYTGTGGTGTAAGTTARGQTASAAAGKGGANDGAAKSVPTTGRQVVGVGVGGGQIITCGSMEDRFSSTDQNLTSLSYGGST